MEDQQNAANKKGAQGNQARATLPVRVLGLR